MKHMDKDGDGLLDFEEFLAGFSLEDTVTGTLVALPMEDGSVLV